MAGLIRVEGNGGTQIYSEPTTESEAKELYVNDTGYTAVRVDIFIFDQCSWNELRDFARRGNA